MPIQYKFPILPALKSSGYSTSILRSEKIIGESMIQKLRRDQLVSWSVLETICKLLSCQPGDLLEYLPEKEENEEQERKEKES